MSSDWLPLNKTSEQQVGGTSVPEMAILGISPPYDIIQRQK